MPLLRDESITATANSTIEYPDPSTRDLINLSRQSIVNLNPRSSRLWYLAPQRINPRNRPGHDESESEALARCFATNDSSWHLNSVIIPPNLSIPEIWWFNLFINVEYHGIEPETLTPLLRYEWILPAPKFRRCTPRYRVPEIFGDSIIPWSQIIY